MTLLLRVELEKLRTVRLTYGLVLTVAALTGLFAVIDIGRRDLGNLRRRFPGDRRGSNQSPPSRAGR